MRLSSIFKPRNKSDAKPALESAGGGRNAARLAQAATLMTQRACGQAIGSLKDIRKENAETEVWLMRAALYAERGDTAKARQSFISMIEALAKETNKRDGWVWLPGIEATEAKTWSAAVQAHLSSFLIASREDGVLDSTVLGGSAEAGPPGHIEGAAPLHRPLVLLVWAARRGAVIARRFGGGLLAGTIFADLEARAFGETGRRVLIIPRDEELVCLSKISDPCVRYAWLARNPGLVTRERDLQKAITDWTEHAGSILSHFQFDALSRWDVLIPRFACLDPKTWPVRSRTSKVLRVLHFDDHPDYAGTAYVEKAVAALRSRGVSVELTSFKRGDEASRRAAFSQADVLVDPLNTPGYSADAVEAMACGLAVVANLQSEFNCLVFRRYSYLDECPARSATPESVSTVLGELAADPSAVDDLGTRGREYVARRHSVTAAAELFAQIEKSLRPKWADQKDPRPSLANLYHPKQWALEHKPSLA